jgi:hypothetical protein
VQWRRRGLTSCARCAPVALNYFNAFLFGTQDGQRDLDTPFFYSFVNFFLSTLAWTPFLFCLQGCVIGGRAVSSTLGFVSWRSFRRFWIVLLMLSCCNVVSITAQNASLVSIPLTINQLLKVRHSPPPSGTPNHPRRVSPLVLGGAMTRLSAAVSLHFALSGSRHHPHALPLVPD